MVGTVLGNYRITSEISSGGMGTVYRAKHELLGRSVAVKLLRPELSANEELVNRFFNEAKAATAIRHPGIIEVFDFGYTDDGKAYLVMELLEGKPLNKALEEVGRFTEWEACSIARGIASALKAAHGQGIVHRDLKPDNVFLVPDLEGPTGGRRAKVLDFGIAKLAETATTNVRHTQTGVLMGTPLYMAPEQARAAGSIDHRADLYSLGCILYELLCGQPPFVAEGAGEIIALQLFAEPEPLRARLAEITPEMDAIVMRLLRKEPHERYQSATEVVAALTSVGRLSHELSSQLPASGSHPQLNLSGRRLAQPSAGLQGGARLTLIEDSGPEPKQKHGAMPIVAGAVTLVLAAAIVTFVLTRSTDDDKPAKADEPVKALVTPVKQDPIKQDESGPAPVKVDVPVVAKQPDPPVRPPPTKIKRPPPPTNRNGKPSGPVTRPDGAAVGGPVTTPQGPVTTNGSPIESTLDDSKKKPTP